MSPSESVIDAASVTDDDWRELASRVGDDPFAYAGAARGDARGCGRDRLFVPKQA
jgi:hypothetical protein